MMLIFNAIEDGWNVIKNEDKYYFTKNHENKKEYLYKGKLYWTYNGKNWIWSEKIIGKKCKDDRKISCKIYSFEDILLCRIFQVGILRFVVAPNKFTNSFIRKLFLYNTLFFCNFFSEVFYQ